MNDEARAREVAGYLVGLAKVYRAFPHAELWGHTSQAEYAATLTDEASEILIAFADAARKPEMTPAEFTAHSIDQLQRVGLAFNAPPDAPSRYHFTNANPLSVTMADDQALEIGDGWLAITEAEYAALSLSPHQGDREAIAREEESVETLARRALFTTELARTDVVNPVNGSAPYTYVKFHGQRVEFHDGEWDTMNERDAGSGKAAAYAQTINDALFELAKRAVEIGQRARPYPDLLSEDEGKALLKLAEDVWADLQSDNLGGFSGINRPFWILYKFKSVIETFGRRDVGLGWSKDQLDAARPEESDAGEVQAVSGREDKERDDAFIWRWIERGLYDNCVSAKEALSLLAHSPLAPWNRGRWDVDHKSYAAKLYADHPKAAAIRKLGE